MLGLPLPAIRRLRQGQTEKSHPRSIKGRSQTDMAYDTLKSVCTSLHVSEILDRIQTQFGVAVDRVSLVSSLSKEVARTDRFLPPKVNTFSLRPKAR